MSDTSFALSDLRAVDLFDDVDDDALAEFAAVARPREAAAGDVLAEVGVVPDGVILLFEGTIVTLIVEGERTEPAARHQPPTWRMILRCTVRCVSARSVNAEAGTVARRHSSTATIRTGRRPR